MAAISYAQFQIENGEFGLHDGDDRIIRFDLVYHILPHQD